MQHSSLRHEFSLLANKGGSGTRKRFIRVPKPPQTRKRASVVRTYRTSKSLFWGATRKMRFSGTYVPHIVSSVHVFPETDLQVRKSRRYIVVQGMFQLLKVFEPPSTVGEFTITCHEEAFALLRVKISLKARIEYLCQYQRAKSACPSYVTKNRRLYAFRRQFNVQNGRRSRPDCYAA